MRRRRRRQTTRRALPDGAHRVVRRAGQRAQRLQVGVRVPVRLEAPPRHAAARVPAGAQRGGAVVRGGHVRGRQARRHPRRRARRAERGGAPHGRAAHRAGGARGGRQVQPQRVLLLPGGGLRAGRRAGAARRRGVDQRRVRRAAGARARAGGGRAAQHAQLAAGHAGAAAPRRDGLRLVVTARGCAPHVARRGWRLRAGRRRRRRVRRRRRLAARVARPRHVNKLRSFAASRCDAAAPSWHSARALAPRARAHWPFRARGTPRDAAASRLALARAARVICARGRIARALAAARRRSST
ncbi:hypothetical protein FGB62_28g221 [Gracilaria domingensis]|nr:hypothetical protein FGB62_28g221 [Gracilaria domingensis]